MANPALVTLTEKTVTKVATNITTGTIHIKKQDVIYIQTYRLTGEAAPSEATMKSEGVLMFDDSNYESIQSSVGIDVYVYCYNADSDSTDIGLIRVDA